MKGVGHRVAITGLGVVAPCGIGKDAYWNGLMGPGITNSRSLEISDWDPQPYFDSPKDARRADRVEQLALAAASEAFAQAGTLNVDPSRFGTIFATGIGGLHTLEEQVIIRVEKGERRVSPFLVPMMMANASGAAISMKYGLQGPNETICTACAAGTHAIGYAARLIAWGRCDAVATGGSECAATLTAHGMRPLRITDVGVAGLHRILDAAEELAAVDAIVVVAGMEGALASVIGGLSGKPVIAVPTNVGYGSGLEGVTALLAMHATCANGVTVVGIDNGYGAACAVARIVRSLRPDQKQAKQA